MTSIPSEKYISFIVICCGYCDCLKSDGASYDEFTFRSHHLACDLSVFVIECFSEAGRSLWKCLRKLITWLHQECGVQMQSWIHFQDITCLSYRTALGI